MSRVDVLPYGPSALLDKVILSLAIVNTVFYPTVNIYCLQSMKSTESMVAPNIFHPYNDLFTSCSGRNL